MKLPCAILSSLFLFAAPVLASQQEEISYEEAVAKCQEFVNDPQLVQIKFKVTCFDEALKWSETEQELVQQENGGLSGHRLIMKEKWYTPDFTVNVSHNATQSTCPILAQFKTTRQAELVLSCDELVEQYANPEILVGYCDEVLAEATPMTEPTGKEINLCGEGASALEN